MASLTIRNLEEPVKARLKIMAAEKGRSMEEEVRQILRSAASARPMSDKPGQAIRRRFAPLGGVDLPSYEQEPVRDPPVFD